MVEFASYEPGTPCWVDLMSGDVDASMAFYKAVFGWDAAERFDDDGNRIYVEFQRDGKPLAGLGGLPPGADGMPSTWNTYIAVDDAEAVQTRITDAGGAVMLPVMQVMAAGRMGVYTDPTGAVFSTWEAGEHWGSAIVNEPSTYSWNELLSRDVAKAKAFYTEVFGWSYDEHDMGPMGTYTLIEGGGNGGLGGMMTMPAELPPMVPNHWMVYFTVADIAAALEAVKNAGGQVAQEPMSAAGVGTFAVIHDPVGASFSILQPDD
ncbi:MAG: VOC family protein [Acidimicrobiales bacterium]